MVYRFNRDHVMTINTKNLKLTNLQLKASDTPDVDPKAFEQTPMKPSSHQKLPSLRSSMLRSSWWRWLRWCWRSFVEDDSPPVVQVIQWCRWGWWWHTNKQNIHNGICFSCSWCDKSWKIWMNKFFLKCRCMSLYMSSNRIRSTEINMACTQNINVANGDHTSDM